MIKLNKKTRFDLSQLDDAVVSELKSNNIGSITTTANCEELGQTIVLKKFLYRLAFVLLLFVGIVISIWVVSMFFASSGVVYVVGGILIILLILVMSFLIYKQTGALIFLLLYNANLKTTKKTAFDCVKGQIISKKEQAYIVRQQDENVTMVEYICEYCFFDGVLRQGYFSGVEKQENADLYQVGMTVNVLFNAKTSIAIKECEVGEYRGIAYENNKKGAIAFLDLLPAKANSPSRAKKTEKSLRLVLRVIGFLVFGVALAIVGYYVYAKIDLSNSQNMAFVIHATGVLFMIVGGLLLIVGFAIIFKWVFEWVSYINLIKNCNFVYGVCYDDGLKSKKRGYSFVYKDIDGVLNTHISSVQASKKATAFTVGDMQPALLLIAYNKYNIDIVDNIVATDSFYPTLKDNNTIAIDSVQPTIGLTANSVNNDNK